MRVLLATDRPDLGHALSLFLSERSIQVVDVVDDFDRLMDRAATARPDVVLVDWSLGEAVSSQMVADLMDRDDPTPGDRPQHDARTGRAPARAERRPTRRSATRRTPCSHAVRGLLARTRRSGG